MKSDSDNCCNFWDLWAVGKIFHPCFLQIGKYKMACVYNFHDWNLRQLQEPKQPRTVCLIICWTGSGYITHLVCGKLKSVALWPQYRALCIKCQSSLWSAALRVSSRSLSPLPICPSRDGDKDCTSPGCSSSQLSASSVLYFYCNQLQCYL